MLRLFSGLILLFSYLNLYSVDFTAELKTDNPSQKINDGVAFVETEGGVPPFTFKWSNQSTPLTSSSCEGLTEGSSFKVIVKDSKGSQIELKGKIPASSAEENINSLFKPIVNGMSSFLFWDPFSAIGVYDPIVYADLKNVKAPGWSDPSVKRITLKEQSLITQVVVKRRIWNHIRFLC